MANLNINRLMSFDHGIENIVHADRNQADTQGLPDRRNLTPSDDFVRTQLTQLLEKPNIGYLLEEALYPEIGSRDLLRPSEFQAALQEAQADLAALADQGGGDNRILNKAARLLREETQLRDLVAMYRSALYQG